MNNIKCDVETCKHNDCKTNCCKLKEIKVGCTCNNDSCKKVEETGHRVGVTALPRFQSTPLYKLE